jgi:cell division septation protein DedD
VTGFVRSALLLGGAMLVGSLLPWPAAAQTDPRLAAAVRLAQEGQGDSARAIVSRVLAATPPTDTLYPQTLLAAATTAATSADRQRALQRIAVEYPNSPWADDALLGLVQLSYAAGDLPAAAKSLERLRLDYPATPLLGTAALWAARVYADAKDPASMCRWVAAGSAAAASDAELRGQLASYASRCAGVDTAASGAVATAGGTSGDTATPPSAAPAATAASAASPPSKPAAPPGAARGPSRLVYRIQVSAAPTRADADRAAAKLRAAGFETAVVQQNGLWKVRGGRYATRAEAQAALGRARERFGGAPFIVADSASDGAR